jgi:hypothetical protein
MPYLRGFYEEREGEENHGSHGLTRILEREKKKVAIMHAASIIAT